MGTQPENRKNSASPPNITRHMAPSEKRRKANLGRVDRYILLEHLGTGGFGAVYRARDQVTEIEVALKLVPSYLSASPDELENIRENFRLVAKLRHPNIANVQHLHTIEYVDPVAETAIGVAPGDCFIVMDYIRGQTITSYRRQFKDSKIPFSKALRIAAQIAEGLDFAHSQGVIHRDIKPGNVIVGDDEQIKILDFGLAAQIRASMVSMSEATQNSSGTPPYMPPEQWTGRQQGPRSDQYGLAVLFYEMISGHVPFASAFETSDQTMMYNVIKNEIPSSLEELKRKQNRALAKALAKNPADRFESCAAFVRALGGRKFLRECRAHSMTTAGPGGTSTVTVNYQSSSPSLWIAALALLTGILGWIGLKAYENYLEIESQRISGQQEARLAETREERINKLLEEARQARDQGEMSNASQALAQLKRIAPGHPEVQGLAEAISSTISLSEIIPLRSEAEMKWNRVEIVDRGQGIGELIDRSRAVLAAANMLYAAQEYHQARDRYRQLLNDYERLQTLVRHRQAALRQAEITAQAQQEALEANAEQHAAEIINGAKELEDSAIKSFGLGEFRKAELLQITAAAEYAKATAVAKGIIAMNFTRQAFHEALEETDSNLLEQYGGALWNDVQQMAESAEQLGQAGNWNQAARLWDDAKKLLLKAVEEALDIKAAPGVLPESGELPRVLLEARAASTLAEADAARVRGNWEATLHFARETLNYKPNSMRAKELLRQALDRIEPKLQIICTVNNLELEGASVSVGDIIENGTTPLTVRLEPKRNYKITVRIDPNRTEERYRPFETVYQAHETGLKILRAELPKAPLPRGFIPVKNAAYAEIDGLTEGSAEALQRQKQAVEKELYLPLEVKTLYADIPMRLVPAGSFTRHMPESFDGDMVELMTEFYFEPGADIDISSPFYVSKYEITRRQWKAVMGNLPPGVNEDETEAEGKDWPITNITWSQTLEFCERLNEMHGVPSGTFRLMREDEWEYACRAGTASPWYTGSLRDDALRAGWYDVNSDGTLHPVGRRAPNAWGLYDFHGNAWEWCLEPYTPRYRTPGQLISETETSFRVIRGGGFDSDIATSRAMHRAKNRMDRPRANLGFRIIRELDATMFKED